MTYRKMLAKYFNWFEDSVTQKKQTILPITNSLLGILKNSKISSEKDYKKFLEYKYSGVPAEGNSPCAMGDRKEAMDAVLSGNG